MPSKKATIAWSRLLVAAGLAATLAASPALAEEGYRHGRLRFVEPGVTLQRATEVSAEEALENLPFLPGDRVWTEADGRVEFQFPDGSVVRLDRRSKLDYAGHEEGQDERIVLRLWSGSAIVRIRSRSFGRFEVETPAGIVQALDRAIVRVDVEAGETRVSVYAGEVILDDGRRQLRLAGGERTYARWGTEAQEPLRFEPGEDDDFARWDGMRESTERWAPRSSEYLPDELDAYAGEFEANGAWRYEGGAGYVWFPSVEAGWQPYSSGHWTWTPYGWTWVPSEPWGWVPSHYGRWGFSVSLGWYWAPGNVWGPGWVSWAVGGGYVGWCPLGWQNRPVAPWGPHHGGYAVPRGRHGAQDPWSVVRHGDMGRRDMGRRRVGAEVVDPTALRVADSALLRPTRDARGLRESPAVPHAISRRPSPGDFVRELGVDNRTTIPAPWTRGYGPPPAGADGARYGVPRRTDGRDESRQSRGRTVARPTPGSTPRAGSSAGNADAARPAPSPAAEGREDRQSGSLFGFPRRQPPGERAQPRRLESGEGSVSRRRVESDAPPAERGGVASRSQPRGDGWGGLLGGYRPRAADQGERAGARSRAEGRGAAGGEYRARSGGGENPGGYRPRSSGDGGRGSQSRGSESRGGASGSRPRAEGSASRSSGGNRGSSGGGHAARPRRDPS